MIAGIDFSTRAVDVVLLDEDTDAAEWHRWPLAGFDAFERARSVRTAVPRGDYWDDVLAVGIEDPRGYNAGVLYRVQGAILAHIPANKLVHPLIPSHWRKTVGLPGNASKADVARYVHSLFGTVTGGFRNGEWFSEWTPLDTRDWPQDACDAYCIALATRTLLEHKDAA